MQQPYQHLMGDKQNLVFVGETGGGKSEAALNFGVALAGEGTKPVHIFDLDQTKPLYRSRDARDVMEQNGITLHYETHFFDSPTVVGGVADSIADPNQYAILDVGGNDTGARMIGRFAKIINRDNTTVFYVVNPYRPWSQDIYGIDGTLSAILKVTRIQKFRILSNPSLGPETTAEEFLQGLERTKELLRDHVPVEGALVREEIYEQVKAMAGIPVLPMRLYLKYEWLQD